MQFAPQKQAGFYAQLRAHNIASVTGQTVLAEQLFTEQFQGKYQVDISSFGKDTSRVPKLWLSNLMRSADDVLRAIYKKGYYTLRKDTFQHDFIALQVLPGKRTILPQDYILDYEKLEAFIRNHLSDIPEAHQELLIQLIQEEIQPNIKFAEQATQAEIDQIVSSIEFYYPPTNEY